MKNYSPIEIIFQTALLFTLLLSFYIFITTFFFGYNKNKTFFNTWQFPMLLALYLDTIYRY